MANFYNEQLKVGKNIQFQSWEMLIPSTLISGEITTLEFEFDIDINILRGSVFDRAVCEDDSASMIVGENKPAGVITNVCNIGDEWLEVSQTVVDYYERGFYVNINGIDLGRCLEVDFFGKRIRVKPITTLININSSVLMTVKFVPHMYLAGTNSIVVMEGSENTSFLQAGTKIKIYYTNNNMDDKTFSIKFEYLY